MLTPMQLYNRDRYLCNRLECAAMIAVDDYREGMPIEATFLAQRLCKLARLHAKVSGRLLVIAANSVMLEDMQ